MESKRLRVVIRTAVILLGSCALLLASGCIGIYNNSDLFKYSGPQEGMAEIELLEKYGTPSFATDVGTQKVYMYKVRDNMYIILVGLFDGKDLIVTCEEGKVTKVNSVERPKAFSLFQPWNWADTD